MRAFKDDRSRAYNDIFPALAAGDVNIGILYPGTIKAFHRHKFQDDYWFVIKGNLRAVVATPQPPKEIVVVPRSMYSLDKPGARVVTGHPAFNTKYTNTERYRVKFYDSPASDGWHQTDAEIVEKIPMPPKVKVTYLSEGECLHIPAGAWHGLQVMGNEEAIMVYHITTKYDPDKPDEERAPWDAFYDWSISRK